MHYPTDSTLLHDSVRVLTRTLQQGCTAQGVSPTRIRNRLRSVGRRVGSEGRISVLKHRHGLRRSRYRGAAGTARWVGLGVIANNLRTTADFLLARAAA